MTRRVAYSLIIVILVVTAASILASLFMPRAKTQPPGVSLENFYRIRRGMTMEQVEAIFGKEFTSGLVMTGNVLYYWDEPGCRVSIRFSYNGDADPEVRAGSYQDAGGSEVLLPTARQRGLLQRMANWVYSSEDNAYSFGNRPAVFAAVRRAA